MESSDRKRVHHGVSENSSSPVENKKLNRDNDNLNSQFDSDNSKLEIIQESSSKSSEEKSESITNPTTYSENNMQDISECEVSTPGAALNTTEADVVLQYPLADLDQQPSCSSTLVHSSNQEEMCSEQTSGQCLESVDNSAVKSSESIGQSSSNQSSPKKEKLGSPSNSAQQPSYYHIKWISWKGQKTPIVTQNENGPCPLIAITNVLILKGRLQLFRDEIIAAEQLTDYVGNCIMESIPKNLPEDAQLNYEQNVHDAMTILLKLQTGLDVNVQFTGVADFEYTPECVVFDLLHIPLYHGWLVDPQSPEMRAVAKYGYNQLVEKIIIDKSSVQPQVVTEALTAEMFLEKTASQLTYHGLCELNATIKDEELCVLFRNNHFITLYKHKKELFQLVTDQGFLTESSVVWETLNNIEGDGQFVDSEFKTLPPRPVSMATVPSEKAKEQQINKDYLIALSLQEEHERERTKDLEWEEYKRKNLGVTDTLRDEELAQILQEEENQFAALQSQQQQQQQHQQHRQLPHSANANGGSKNKDIPGCQIAVGHQQMKANQGSLAETLVCSSLTAAVI